VAELLALLALAAALAAAIVRDHRVPEAAVALGGAAILVLAGVLSWSDARHEAGDLASTLATLAGLLVLGLGCERAGVFDWLAARMAQGARGSAIRLLGLVFGAAAGTTAVLGLDATVVLLTPAVFAAAARARVPGRPHVFACTHLANSASLLLPVSNLTNLLAFGATSISFTRFAGLMALPWAVALGLEWAGHRLAFRSELAATGTAAAIGDVRAPRAPLIVLALTLVGFAVTGPLGVAAAWPAVAGAVLMTAVERPGLRELLRAIDLPLLGFVLGLGIIVRGVAGHGLGDLVSDLLPGGGGLLALLATAAIAAVLANLLNNVPALLVLLPAVTAAGTPAVLAALIGVNVGPNLTYTGSLATLLWRRVLHARGEQPDLGTFLRLGAVTVPAILVGATVALWLALKVIG
jgi:arsenical pump membrane protein